MAEKFKLIPDEIRARMRAAADPTSANETIAVQQAQSDTRSMNLNNLSGPQTPTHEALAPHKAASPIGSKPLR